MTTRNTGDGAEARSAGITTATVASSFAISVVAAASSGAVVTVAPEAVQRLLKRARGSRSGRVRWGNHHRVDGRRLPFAQR